MSKQTKTVSIAGFLYYYKPLYGDAEGHYSFSSWKFDPEYLFGMVFVKELTIDVDASVELNHLQALEMS